MSSSSDGEIGPGVVLEGRFRLDGLLGRGGTARVYRGEDLELRVARAVKVLHAEWTPGRDQLRKRLRDEARAMAQIRHPRVLAVHDVGTFGDADFVVMDLAEGGSLAALVEREGPLPEGEALRVVGEVMEALAAAHAAGIVHRDVKPQNVLLDQDRHVLLADFGIALLTAEEATRQTRSGVAMGSMAYMAPEQRMDARNVRGTADIYAAGASLYSVLTGQTPMDLFMVGEASERLAALSPAARRVVVRATRYEPERRYLEAREMAADIALAIEEVGGAATRGALLPAPSDAVAGVSVAAGGREAFPADGSGGTVVAGPRPRRWALRAGVGAMVVLAGLLLSQVLGREETPIVEVAPEPSMPLPDVVAAVEPEPSVAPSPSTTAVKPMSTPLDRAVTTEVEKAAVVTPVPVAAAPDVAVREAPFGRWSGTYGGRVARFRFDGSESDVAGTVTVTWQGQSVGTPVTGRYDAAARRMELSDAIDVPDGGTYVLTFAADLGGFSGSFARRDGQGRVLLQGWR